MRWGAIPIAPSAQSPQVSLAGFSTATSTRITMTSNATAHTKGAWTELFTATTFNVTLIELIVQGTATSGANRHMLCDIGIGSSGNETVLVPNIAIGTTGGTRKFTLPIWIPQGTRIAVRYQTATASLAMEVQAVVQNTGHSQAETGSTATAYGINLGASSGTSLSVPAAINTTGPWTQLVAATPTTTRALLLTMQGPAGSNWTPATNALFEFGYGASGSEQSLISGIFMSWTTSEMTDGPTLTIPVNLPTGTRLVARYRASDIAQGPTVAVVGIG